MRTQRPSVPLGFQGLWGMQPRDCDLSRSDGAGRLVMNAREVIFRDGRTEPARVTMLSPVAVELDLLPVGENKGKERRIAFALRDNGFTLMRADRSGSAPVRYARCPA